MERVEIPNKRFFKLNEVCSLTSVKSYVLRYWEAEFPQIAPICGEDGQKMYQGRDIDCILKIKKYLFEDKLSIERAKANVENDFSLFLVQDQGNTHVTAEEYAQEVATQSLPSEFKAELKSKLSQILNTIEELKIRVSKI